MNVNFPIGLGSTPFIAVSDSGIVSRLRLAANQTLQGLVVDVAGDNVVLSLDGRLVEARTQVPLSVGEIITLQVKVTSDNQVLMRLMPQRGNSWRPITDQDLTNLLQSMQLPPDKANQQIVRQLMAQGFELSRENVLDVRDALPPGVVPDEANIESAVFLRSLGLPVTEETLQLARGRLTEPGDRGSQMAGLERTIQDFLANSESDQVLDPELRSFRGLLRATLSKLETMRLHPGPADPTALSQELNRLVVALGDSVEGKILRLTEQGQNVAVLKDGEQGLLLALAKGARDHLSAQDIMTPGQLIRLEGEAGRLLESVHFEQMLNAATFTDQDGTYLFSLPVLDNGQVRTLRMKVSPDAQQGNPSGKGKPVVRVELDLDLTALGPTIIDLAFDDRRLHCHFANSDSDTVGLLKRQGPSLISALSERGFEVGSLTCGQSVAKTSEASPLVKASPGTLRVDIQA